MRRVLVSCGVMMLGSSAVLASSCVLGSYQAEYAVFGRNDKAIGVHREKLLLPSPGQYQLVNYHEMHVMMFKESIDATSTGVVDSMSLRPAHYKMKEHLSKKHIEFKVKPGYQDPISYLLALRLSFLSQPAVPFSARVQMNATETGNAEKITLRRLPKETMSLSMGRFQTVRVTRHSAKGLTNSYWLAPKLAYQPVRFQVVKEGKTVYSEQLVRLKRLPGKACLWR